MLLEQGVGHRQAKVRGWLVQVIIGLHNVPGPSPLVESLYFWCVWQVLAVAVDGKYCAFPWLRTGHDEELGCHQVGVVDCFHRPLKVGHCLHDLSSKKGVSLSTASLHGGQICRLVVGETRILLESPTVVAHGSGDANLPRPLSRNEERLPILDELNIEGDVRPVQLLAPNLKFEFVVHVSSMNDIPVRLCHQNATAESRVMELVHMIPEDEEFRGHSRVVHSVNNTLNLPPVIIIDNGGLQPRLLTLLAEARIQRILPSLHHEREFNFVVLSDAPPALFWSGI
mmetsp:Transcript_115106/g.245964  ORF Transcript_115106/g.245964 Transcript_115106/m.245964 type:complete len:284 (+) Transcript_115106:460-1311(+)